MNAPVEEFGVRQLVQNTVSNIFEIRVNPDFLQGYNIVRRGRELVGYGTQTLYAILSHIFQAPVFLRFSKVGV